MGPSRTLSRSASVPSGFVEMSRKSAFHVPRSKKSKKQLKVQWSVQNEETIFAAPVEYVKVVLRPQGAMEAKSPAPESKGTDDCAAEASRSKWQALLGAADKAHQTMTRYRQLRLIYDFDPMRPTEFTNLWAEAEERVKARQGIRPVARRDGQSHSRR